MAAITPEPDHPGRRLASVTHAMSYMDCSRNTIYRLIAERRIEAYKVGRLLRVDLDSIDAALKPVIGDHP